MATDDSIITLAEDRLRMIDQYSRDCAARIAAAQKALRLARENQGLAARQVPKPLLPAACRKRKFKCRIDMDGAAPEIFVFEIEPLIVDECQESDFPVDYENITFRVLSLSGCPINFDHYDKKLLRELIVGAASSPM